MLNSSHFTDENPETAKKMVLRLNATKGHFLKHTYTHNGDNYKKALITQPWTELFCNEYRSLTLFYDLWNTYLK